MISGIGTDIARKDRFGDNTNKLAERILTEYELAEFNKSKDTISYVAKKWAAKEAISKAFGTGMAGNTKWKNIEIRHTGTGAPFAIFKNEMYAHCEILNIKCNISISDEDEYAVAFAILER